MRRLPHLFLSAMICLAPAAGASAQSGAGARQEKAAPGGGAQEVGDGDVVRVSTSLVKVPVTVRDREGNYVGGLRREDFSLFDEGAEQQIAHFAGVEAPVNVVLLIDVSCSIVKPADTVGAALAFVEQMRPGDAALPIAFGQNIYALLTESTRDKELLRQRLRELPDKKNIPCDGGTRLGDAVEFVVHLILAHGKGRRAVILFSDGRDSKISKQGWGPRSLHAVSEAGVPFYSLRLRSSKEPLFSSFPGDSFEATAPRAAANAALEGYMDELAIISGGRWFPEATGETLKKNIEGIGEELRHQYLLEYYPPQKEDPAKGQSAGAKPERRKIKVRLVRKGLAVRARDSYIYDPSAR